MDAMEACVNVSSVFMGVELFSCGILFPPQICRILHGILPKVISDADIFSLPER